MPSSQADKLRRKIGEDVPSGGTADDTLFSDEEIQEILDENPIWESAVRVAWETKATRLSNLTDVNEGGSRRPLSQLHDKALKQLELALIQERRALGEVGVVTKVHTIARRRRAADAPKATEYGGAPGSPPWHRPYPFR